RAGGEIALVEHHAGHRDGVERVRLADQQTRSVQRKDDVLSGRTGALEQAAVTREAGHASDPATDRTSSGVGIDHDVAGNGAADNGTEVQVLDSGEGERLDDDPTSFGLS